jgi:hypothetical protein
VVLGGIGFAGLGTWNYMMHDNEFCSGCHIMAVPFQRFGTSEHAKLKCHDCHRQSIFASSIELYIQVTERPDSIPAHRTVPNVICAECHIQKDADSTWKRVSATGGTPGAPQPAFAAHVPDGVHDVPRARGAPLQARERNLRPVRLP